MGPRGASPSCSVVAMGIGFALKERQALLGYVMWAAVKLSWHQKACQMARSLCWMRASIQIMHRNENCIKLAQFMRFAILHDHVHAVFHPDGTVGIGWKTLGKKGVYEKGREASASSESSDFLVFWSDSWLLSKSNTKLTSGASTARQASFNT